jgi:hypothetical protein
MRKVARVAECRVLCTAQLRYSREGSVRPEILTFDLPNLAAPERTFQKLVITEFTLSTIRVRRPIPSYLNWLRCVQMLTARRRFPPPFLKTRFA